MSTSREQFEAWIKAPPFERSVERWPNCDEKFAWPGQYRDYPVQLAWEAWEESRRESGHSELIAESERLIARLTEATRELRERVNIKRGGNIRMKTDSGIQDLGEFTPTCAWDENSKVWRVSPDNM